jgi:hypothetical protein
MAGMTQGTPLVRVCASESVRAGACGCVGQGFWQQGCTTMGSHGGEIPLGWSYGVCRLDRMGGVIGSGQ